MSHPSRYSRASGPWLTYGIAGDTDVRIFEPVGLGSPGDLHTVPP